MIEQITAAIQVRINAQLRNQQRFLSYLDTQFSIMKLWPDWVVLRTAIQRSIACPQENTRFDTRKRQKRIWTAFLAMHSQEEEASLMPAMLAFITAISDDELPLYVLHLHIARLILQGQKEEVATEQYRKYLSQEPENAIYQDYAITQDFQVIPAVDYRREIASRNRAQTDHDITS